MHPSIDMCICGFNFHWPPVRPYYVAFPCGSDSKESACSVGDPGSIPGLGGSPGEGNGYPLQYSCLENPMDRGAWRATIHGVSNSQTRLTLSLSYCRLGHSFCSSVAYCNERDKRGNKELTCHVTKFWNWSSSLPSLLPPSLLLSIPSLFAYSRVLWGTAWTSFSFSKKHQYRKKLLFLKLPVMFLFLWRQRTDFFINRRITL